MADQNNFSQSMESMLKGMEGFINSKSVVGDPITLGDAVILPLVDISFGCASGAGVSSKNNKDAAAGGLSGKITPSAVLVIQNGTTKLVNISSSDNISKIIDLVPDIVNRFTSGKGVTVEDEEVKAAVTEK